MNNWLKHGHKAWKDTLPNKILKWQGSMWKDVQHYMPLRNWKLKQWDTTPIRMAKIQTVTTTNAGEDVTRRTFIIGGNSANLETIWKFLTKINILSTKNHVTWYSWYLPKELNTYVHTKTCTQAFRSDLFIIAKTQEQPVCLSSSMDKLWYIQTMAQYSTKNKTKPKNPPSHTKICEVHFIKWKSDWKGYILYDSNYTTLWKWWNYNDKTHQWFPGAERVERVRVE